MIKGGEMKAACIITLSISILLCTWLIFWCISEEQKINEMKNTTEYGTPALEYLPYNCRIHRNCNAQIMRARR